MTCQKSPNKWCTLIVLLGVGTGSGHMYVVRENEPKNRAGSSIIVEITRRSKAKNYYFRSNCNVAFRVFCYFTLCSNLRPPSQHAAVNRRRRRTNIFLALITAVFFLGWAPMVLYSVLFDFFIDLLPQRQSMIYVGYAGTLAIGMLTAIANPILYTSLNEGFREAAPAFCKSVLFYSLVHTKECSNLGPI